MIYLFITSFLLVTVLLSLYSLRALKHSFNSAKTYKLTRNIVIGAVAFVILALCLELVSRYFKLNIKYSDRIAVLGCITLAIPMLMTFLLSVPIEIAEFFTKSRLKVARKVVLGISAFIFCYVMYSFLTPSVIYETRHVDIKIKNLPEALEGYTILQLSDIHIGNLTKDEKHALVTRLVEQCNELNANILVLTGDIITSSPSELIGNDSFLGKLKAKDGKYFIFGNHDIGMYNKHLSVQELQEDINSVASIMAKNDFVVLSDSLLTIDVNKTPLFVLGVNENSKEDYVERYNKVAKTLSEKDIVISLSHNPSYYSMLLERENQYVSQLTLAGHTHAAQIEILGFSVSDIFFKYARDLYEQNGKYLYVNRGLGYHFYRRIGSKPEITLLKLTSDM